MALSSLCSLLWPWICPLIAFDSLLAGITGLYHKVQLNSSSLARNQKIPPSYSKICPWWGDKTHPSSLGEREMRVMRGAVLEDRGWVHENSWPLGTLERRKEVGWQRSKWETFQFNSRTRWTREEVWPPSQASPESSCPHSYVYRLLWRSCRAWPVSSWV